jgi:thiol-disulfide isomerase/thioredoxin
MTLKNLALACAVLALLHGCGGSDSSAPVATTTPAPAATPAATPATTAAATTVASTVASTDSKFQSLDGQPLDLSAYAGKKVFVNYWATWCAPCIREIPALTRAALELEDENYVFLLASDESIDTIQDFVAEREFTGNFIKLNKFVGAWGIEVMPTSELYDESGNHVVTWNGAFEWDSMEMLDAIRHGTPMSLTRPQ